MAKRRFSINPALQGMKAYTDVVEVKGGARTLYISGQLGLRDDGTVADDIEVQCRQAFDNLGRALDAGGMTFENLVMIRIYLVDSEDVAVLRRVRDEMLPGPVASTLLIVQSLADPSWKVEIDAVAAED